MHTTNAYAYNSVTQENVFAVFARMRYTNPRTFLFFYERALGAKGLENDRERSWRWRERSRAFLQERSSTKLAPGLYRLYRRETTVEQTDTGSGITV